MFPALQSMTEDISKLELPNNPVLSTAESADDDIPELPELTTRNLQVQINEVPDKNNFLMQFKWKIFNGWKMFNLGIFNVQSYCRV